VDFVKGLSVGAHVVIDNVGEVRVARLDRANKGREIVYVEKQNVVVHFEKDIVLFVLKRCSVMAVEIVPTRLV
jgi:hypothetical protein